MDSTQDSILSRRRVLAAVATAVGCGVCLGCGEEDVIVPKVDPNRKTRRQLEREEEEALLSKSKSRKSRPKR